MSGGQAPILAVTLNPALDLSGAVARLEPGVKLRLEGLRTDPGGGGVNVARVVARLGGEVRAFAALGGPTGARLGALIAAEGVAVVAHPAPGETRESLTVRDAATGGEYRFVLPGPAWSEAQAEAACAAVARAAGLGWVVLSGSQPPGLGAGFALRLRGALAPGARLAVDTSGAALAALVAARAGLDLLRMDGAEAEAVAGAPVPDAAALADLAGRLVADGVARMVVMARGAEGSVLAAPGLRLLCRPPPVEVASAVGAGDSFTGAFVLALARGLPPAEALRQGTAAAAAAVMTPGTELCRPADVERLAPRCALRAL